MLSAFFRLQFLALSENCEIPDLSSHGDISDMESANDDFYQDRILDHNEDPILLKNREQAGV